jgi:hypothetical protein
LEAAKHRHLLTEIAVKLDQGDFRVLLGELGKTRSRGVGAPVIDEQKLVGNAQRVERGFQLPAKERE